MSLQLNFEIRDYLDLIGKECQVIFTRKKHKHEWFKYKENQVICASKASIVGIPSKFKIAAIKPGTASNSYTIKFINI